MVRKPKLTEATRAQIANLLADGMLDTWFGDGQELEMIWDGFPRWVGINHLSDRRLVAEYAQHVDEDEPDELLLRARAELRGAGAVRKLTRG